MGLILGLANGIPAESGYLYAIDYGTAQDDVTLLAAIKAIGSTQQTLVLSYGTWTIAENLTIPSNIELLIKDGASFCVHEAKKLTFMSPPSVGLQHFIQIGCPGDVFFAKPSPVFFPQWWGAVADDGLDDRPAFDRAFSVLRLAGGGEMNIPAGVYDWIGSSGPGFKTAETFTREASNIVIRGAGIDATTIRHRGMTGLRLGLPRADVNRYCTPPLNPPTGCFANAWGFPPYKRMRDANAGSRVVTLVDARDASVFSVGSVVFIESDIATTNGNTPALSEYNEVVAIDTASGTLKLKSPLEFDYVTTNPDWPPFIAPISVVPSNIVISDMTIRKEDGPYAVFEVYGVRKATIERVRLVDGYMFTAFSDDVAFKHCIFEYTTESPTQPAMEVGDASKRFVLENSTVQNFGYAGINVWSYGAKIVGNTVTLPQYVNGKSAFGIRLFGYPLWPSLATVVHGNRVNVNDPDAPGAIGIYAFHARGMRITNNSVILAPSPSAIFVGIGLEGNSTDNVLSKNSIYSASTTAGIGMRLRSSSGTLISGNELIGNGIDVPQQGIQLVQYLGGSITDNLISRNRIKALIPVDLGVTTGNTVVGNF
ncbi:MAG TPA: right-handed parallel beta-helix repeat-containing protein [Candidatus Tectomicrobia bacterium]|nr:right-handed parallel beta-helix repeat-containing protein [Candidatus Tectomicrobia bacterium]